MEKTAQIEQESEEEDIEFLKEEDEEISDKSKVSEEVKERIAFIRQISHCGNEGKGLAIEMLLALQQEFPEAQSISHYLEFLLQETNVPKIIPFPYQPVAISTTSTRVPMLTSMPPHAYTTAYSNNPALRGSPYPLFQSNFPVSLRPQPPSIPPNQIFQQQKSLHSSSAYPQPLPPKFTPKVGPPLQGALHSGIQTPLGNVRNTPTFSNAAHTASQSHQPPLKGINSASSMPNSLPINFHPQMMARPIDMYLSGKGMPLQHFEKLPSLSNEDSANSTIAPLKRKKAKGKNLPAQKRQAVELALSDKMTDIFQLAMKGEFITFKQALNLTNLRSVDDKGNTLLHQVVLHQRPVEFIALIMKRGHSVNEQNKEGNTALHLAVQMGIVRIIKKLFEYHPNKELLNSASKTAEQMNKAKNIKLLFANQHTTHPEKESGLPSIEEKE